MLGNQARLPGWLVIGSQAAGAELELRRNSIYNPRRLTHIGLKPTLGVAVGVTDRVPRVRALVTDLALHSSTLAKPSTFD